MALVAVFTFSTVPFTGILKEELMRFTERYETSGLEWGGNTVPSVIQLQARWMHQIRLAALVIFNTERFTPLRRNARSCYLASFQIFSSVLQTLKRLLVL